MPPQDDIDQAFARFRRSGSPRELAQVYDALAPELLRLAWHTTGNAADAEDVLQATFVTAIERAQAFDPARRVTPWLTGILANEARGLRRRRGLPPDPTRARAARSSSPAQEAEAREFDQALAQALERTPEAFRPVLHLHFVHGLSASEIAAALGRPAGTVRSQLARGTEQLRRSLPLGLFGGCTDGPVAVARVRASLLARPELAPRPLSSLPLGLLAMKKVLALVAAVLALVVTWRATRPAAGPAQPTAAGDAHMASLAPEARPEARTLPAEPAGEREAVLPDPPPPSAAPLAPTTALVVEATWPEGGPAAGEIVLLTTLDRPRLDEPLTGATGSDGRARFEIRPGSVNVRLLRGGERSLVLAPGRETAVALSLFGGVRVHGHVVERDGRPVPAARIWLSERYRTDLGHVVTTSDAEGRFELRCVGPDHYLGAQKAGFAPSGLAHVQGAEGAERDVLLHLEPTGSELRGVVLDPDGGPVAGAHLVLGREQVEWVRGLDGYYVPGAPPLRAFSASDGSFVFDGGPAGLAPLLVRARGCAPWSGTVELFEGATERITVTLEREARVLGRVTDAEGRARSVQVGAGAPESLAGVTSWSGTDGRFVLDGVATGTVSVWARDGAEEAQAELQLAPGETRTWEARLERRPRIRGRLVDAHGAPAGGLTVVAVWPEERGSRSRSQPSDAQGRFEIGPLEDREHLLMVHPPAGWREFPLAELPGVRPSEDEVLLRLADPATRATLVGEVVAPGGAPLGGAELGLWHHERAVWRAFVSDESGRLVAANLPPGTVDLELRHPLHPWLSVGERTLAPGETLDLGRLEFEPSGSLRVRLEGARGADLRGLTTLLARAPRHESGVLRLEGGELVSGALAAGIHTLRVQADGFLQIQREVEVRAGVEELLELRLVPGGTRRVRIERPAGLPPPAWVSCSLFDASGAQVWRGNADLSSASASVQLSAPPGEHELRVAADGGLSGRLAVLVPTIGAELPELVLQLARGD